MDWGEKGIKKGLQCGLGRCQETKEEGQRPVHIRDSGWGMPGNLLVDNNEDGKKRMPALPGEKKRYALEKRKTGKAT